MKKLAILILCVLLAGCAPRSGVVQMSTDAFMVSRGAATGFFDLDTLKADAFREANQYCISQDKNIHVVNIAESSPPHLLGNFPRVKIHFKCLEKTDPELTQPKMRKSPGTVIEGR